MHSTLRRLPNKRPTKLCTTCSPCSAPKHSSYHTHQPRYICTTTSTPTTHNQTHHNNPNNTMSSILFPRFNEFSPIFQLANEIDRATRSSSSAMSSRSFAPKFDVKELKDHYELKGDLPGVEQKNINIEWADESTLTISGSTESSFSSTNVSDVTDDQAAAAEGNGSGYHKPTVEEEGQEQQQKQVTKTSEGRKDVTRAADEHQPRYWITERSVGSFARTFNFPTGVDHDGVKASLKQGVLNIFVPKAKKASPRRVMIE